jgi:hypothetical protein
MGILPPQFSDQQIGLEAPPTVASRAPQAVVAVITLVCPNCGSQDAAVQQADNASVAHCPQCQAEFEPPPASQAVIPMESSLHRILGALFERHMRRQTHRLKRTVQSRRAVSQHQLHQPELSGTV